MENAIAIRMAFNAEGKDFQKFLDQYSNEDPEEKEARKVAEGVKALTKFFGGK